MSKPSQLNLDRSAYLRSDTIASLATPAGGAICVIRVSGPEAVRSLSLFSREPLRLIPQKIMRIEILQPPLQATESGPCNTSERLKLDKALYTFFKAPRSYTGEDVVEIYLHGNPFLAQKILEILRSHGVLQALPGEFSFRAVKNGKMSISQAQAVPELISSFNETALNHALDKLSGMQQEFLETIANELREIASLSEVGIDFSDQDIEEVTLPFLKRRLQPIFEKLSRLKASFKRGSKLQDGFRAVLLGVPNSGKSSFFNAILGENRSIVSEISGTTRDIVHERISLKGQLQSVTLRFEDTAGLRTATDKVEAIGVQRALAAAKTADLILLVWDPTADNQEAQEAWKSLIDSPSIKIGIMTKMDLVNANETSTFIEKAAVFLPMVKWLPISSTTGEGIQEAVNAIVDQCSQLTRRESDELLLTRIQDFEAVSQALTPLNRSVATTELSLFASDLRHALQTLSPMIGETVADDLLEKIFSEFCIGK